MNLVPETQRSLKTYCTFNIGVLASVYGRREGEGEERDMR